MGNNSCRICPMVLGCSLGVFWGLSVFFLGLIAHWYPSYGAEFIKVIQSIYPGYAATIKGSFIGLGWGFVDLFCAGFLFALIFNALTKCKSCGHRCKSE